MTHVPDPGSPAAVALGLFHLGLLTAVGLTVGHGALALVRFPAEPARRWLLAPFAATVVWTLTGNLAVRFGLTLAQAAPGVAVVTLGLAVLGIRALRGRPRPGPPALVAALGLLAGILVWPYVVRGLTAHLGSPNGDTYHYTSTAAALWRYGLASGSTALPFFQRYAPYADALGEARNHAFVLLALFSPIVQAGEPMFVRNLFAWWAVFLLACNLAFYRVSWSDADPRPAPPVWQIFAYVVPTAGIGWALVPAVVGNWDNALLVSVGPLLAALARERAGSPGYGIVLGATVAYAVYTYTELAPLLGLFLLPLFLRGGLPIRRPGALSAAMLAVATAGALLGPGLGPLWGYLLHQVAASRIPEGVRPGGAFAVGFVSRPGDLSGWWALGAEHGARPAGAWPWICGLVLTGLVAAGVVRLVRHRRWGEIGSVGVMAVSLVYFVLVQRYGYAAYKILSVGWWLVGRLLVEGAAGSLAVARARPGVRPPGRLPAGVLAGVLAAALLICLFVAERHRFELFFSEAVFRQQPTLAVLTRLRVAAAGQPPLTVLIGPELGADGVTLPWIYYAFKDTRLRPFHASALTIPGGAAWPAEGLPFETILRRSDAVHSDAVHEGPPRFRTPEFALVDLESAVVIAGIDSPNQLEGWGTWLGTGPIGITLLAGGRLSVVLSFEAAPGPSRPETPRRTLVLTAGARPLGRVEIEGPTRVAFPFVATGGREVLSLATPDAPTVGTLANGDSRPLLVGIRDLKITPRGPGP